MFIYDTSRFRFTTLEATQAFVISSVAKRVEKYQGILRFILNNYKTDSSRSEDISPDLNSP